MEKATPHVLIFPLPLLGHISPVLQLAEVLSLRGIRVTVLTTDHVKRRLGSDDENRPMGRKRFSLLSIPDGLPADHPRSAGQFLEVLRSLMVNSRHAYRDVLVSSCKISKTPPVTCAIVDGLMPFAAEVAEEEEIPFIVFRTSGPCSFWAYFSVPKLIEAGELPFPEECDMDELVRSVPGMETFLRRRDLPTICRVRDANDAHLQALSSSTQRTTRARGLIFNSIEQLDAALLTHINSCCPRTYTIGPIGELLRSLDCSVGSPPEWWREDRSYAAWLDAQPSKSVVYVSFGSLTVLRRSQILEFWHGLVSSGYRFIWAVRPDLLDGAGDVAAELKAWTEEKGCVVEWVNQTAVLAHPSVGAFLTHSGWNSTLEGICAGVPMICWPFFFDQMVNSRFVSEVWRIGLDMKDTCDRGTVAKMVKQAMEGESAEEMRRNVGRLSEMARQSVDEGGSSRVHLEQLVHDIRALSLEASALKVGKSV
ncbi:7-deoxyloganetic acid glucosyltransferase-like [Wolffia australiana]